MKKMIWVLGVLLAAQAWGADKTTYFSCVVNEPGEHPGDTVKVTVKFAVKNLDIWKETAELIQYPGVDEDMGAILVRPKMIGKSWPMMGNLNSQGGDLRLEGDNIRLFGDGDGYQFTDLVIWDVDDEEDVLEGYVRDYGSARGDSETFKQFIKCKRSSKVL